MAAAMENFPWTKDAGTKLEWEENPHKQGTDKYTKFENCKGAATVGEAKSRGASNWDLAEWAKKGKVKTQSAKEEEGVVKAKLMKLEKAKRLLSPQTTEAKSPQTEPCTKNKRGEENMDVVPMLDLPPADGMDTLPHMTQVPKLSI